MAGWMDGWLDDNCLKNNQQYSQTQRIDRNKEDTMHMDTQTNVQVYSILH